MVEGDRVQDTEERLAVLRHQLDCLENDRNVADLGNDITMDSDQIRAEIERLVREFERREGVGEE